MASNRNSESAPRGLIALIVLVGAMAFVCGIGLIINGLGMPEAELDGTPFSSYLIPGLVLCLVVGGSLLGAACLAHRQSPLASLATLGAGCVLLGWIIVEAVLINAGRALQGAIFLIALTIIFWSVQWRSTANHLSVDGRDLSIR
jgi:hypothetical protein